MLLGILRLLLIICWRNLRSFKGKIDIKTSSFECLDLKLIMYNYMHEFFNSVRLSCINFNRINSIHMQHSKNKFWFYNKGLIVFPRNHEYLMLNCKKTHGIKVYHPMPENTRPMNEQIEFLIGIHFIIWS